MVKPANILAHEALALRLMTTVRREPTTVKLLRRIGNVIKIIVYWKRFSECVNFSSSSLTRSSMVYIVFCATAPSASDLELFFLNSSTHMDNSVFCCSKSVTWSSLVISKCSLLSSCGNTPYYLYLIVIFINHS